MRTTSDETRNPSEDEIFDKVASIVSELFDIEKDDVKMDSLLEEDLGADGLDIVELIMTLEQEFGIIMPDEIFIPIDLQEADSDVVEELDEEEDVDADEENYPDEDIDDEDIDEKDIDEKDIDEDDIDEEENYDYTPSEPYTLTIADYVSFIHKTLIDIED